MVRTLKALLFITVSLFVLVGCVPAGEMLDVLFEDTDKTTDEQITALEDLTDTEHFLDNALAHILEGELNRNGDAVGFHHDRLPTRLGEVIEGTETEENEYGVYEAKVSVDGVDKTSNNGKSTLFPDEWDTQDVVDAINEAYDVREQLIGNTYAGITEEGMEIHMYLTEQDKIISAFPIY